MTIQRDNYIEKELVFLTVQNIPRVFFATLVSPSVVVGIYWSYFSNHTLLISWLFLVLL
jgi:hypothetical protein